MGTRFTRFMMVKICGITRREDAVAAAEAGASALGFIFYPNSPRYVTPEKARELGDGLEPWKVGVFVDESPEDIERIVVEAKLDIAQIYGPGLTRGSRVWLAVRPGVPGGKSWAVDHRWPLEAILFDGLAKDVSDDWAVLHQFAALCDSKPHVIIAGGLNPLNVADAIRAWQPWGVDASSGLETSPGIKDHEKVRQFVLAAKQAAAREASQ